MIATDISNRAESLPLEQPSFVDGVRSRITRFVTA